MAADASTTHEQLLEEEYIDIDISSTTFLCYTIPSPPPSRDFEFHHLSSNPLGSEEDSTTSPADELFYKGKLLPLHLPPRLQMVEKLLTNTTAAAAAACKSTYSTPLESCNISPSSSCYVSGELNPAEENHSHYSPGVFQGSKKKSSWCKKLKESSLGLKLKASRAYIKSLFTKPGCSYESGAAPKAEYGGYTRSTEKRSPFLQIRKESCCRTDMKRKAEEGPVHRRSFTSVIGLHQSTNNASSTPSSCSSSTSSSFSSASSSDERHCGGPEVLKRSSSARSEVENPIQGAIAYCKKTQQSTPGGRLHSVIWGTPQL